MGIPTAPERRAPIVFQVEEYGCSPCVAMLPKKVERREPLIGNTLLGNKIPKMYIHIMFPMIATLEDVERARAITEQVRQELNAPPVPLGIMIEVPSAVVLADHLAREVDFFSIGTNDLTQYMLAMDRLHPQLARQADALHPAVLRMIEKAVQATRKEGKWVGVCGGIAGDLKGATILTGLGVAELSVSVPSIAAVKAHLRSRSLTDMQQIAQQALQCRTAAEVRSL